MLVKVALFDFDNTISHGDTIVSLLKYYCFKHPLSVVNFIKVGILYIGYLLHISSFESAKSALLFPLAHMHDEELEWFYHNKVEPEYYLNVVEELRKKKEAGYIVIVCTASSEVYMKYNSLPIDHLIGTKTNGNKIIGKNCKNAHKVDYINDYLKEKDYVIDYDHSYAYSDSKSDLPMLSMVKNRIRVEKKTGNMTTWEGI